MMTLFTIVGVAAILASPLILIVDHAVRRSTSPLGRSGGTRAEVGERPGGEACGTPIAAPRRDELHRHRYYPRLARICVICGVPLDEAANPLTPSFPVTTPGFEAAPSATSGETSLDVAEGASNFP